MEKMSPRKYTDWEAVLAFSTASLSLSEQDVEELRSERSIRSTKTKEEIERLMVDESLDLLERSIFLLRSGQNVQKVNAIENLKTLLTERQSETLEKFVTHARDSLRNGTEELHIAASRVFCDIAESETLSGSTYARYLLPIILDNISHENLDISKSWLDALLASLPFLPSKTINDEILNLARSMGTLTQAVSSRLSCCSLLGKLAINLDQMSVKRDLLKLVTSLCQDVEMEVRAAMCQQLDSVAKGVGLELTKNTILPELVELTKDEQMLVREAGIETVSNTLNLLDDDSCTDIVIPLVLNYCQKVVEKQNEEEVITVAKHIGKLCYGLSVNLTKEQKGTFLDCYIKLCDCGDPSNSPRQSSSPKKPFSFNTGCVFQDRKAECRKWCAYNFPAMLLFNGAENFSSTLMNTFQQMVNDPHVFVRKTMACGLHEVCKILCSHIGLIQGEIKTLLQDDSIEVLEGLIPHLSTTIETLSKEGSSQNSTSPVVMSDFIAPLLSCELCISLSSNWRLHVEFLTMMACLPTGFTSDQIYYKFVPVLFRLLSSNRVVPVKRAAGRTLCVFIKHNKRGEQRQELCKRIIQELGKGRKHRTRLIFLDICEYIMELFSKSFFKEHFFDLVLLLGQDPVVNVRLRVCSMYPALKSQIKLPGDRPLMQTLEQHVRQLMTTENDRDVSNSIRNSVLKMDRIQVARDTSTTENVKEEDVIDRLKEEQEKQILEDERKHETLVNRITANQNSSGNNHKKLNPTSSSSKDLTKKVLLNKAQSKLKDLNVKQSATKSDGNINVGSSSASSLSGKVSNLRRTSQPVNVARASSFTPGDTKQRGARSTVTMRVNPSKTGKISTVDTRTTTTKKTVGVQNAKRS